MCKLTTCDKTCSNKESSGFTPEWDLWPGDVGGSSLQGQTAERNPIKVLPGHQSCHRVLQLTDLELLIQEQQDAQMLKPHLPFALQPLSLCRLCRDRTFDTYERKTTHSRGLNATTVVSTCCWLPRQRAQVELQVTLQVFQSRFVGLQAWSRVLQHISR